MFIWGYAYRMDEVDDIYKEFIETGYKHLGEQPTHVMYDKIRMESLFKLMVEKNIATDEEIKTMNAREMLKVIEYLKRSPVVSPIQQDGIE